MRVIVHVGRQTLWFCGLCLTLGGAGCAERSQRTPREETVVAAAGHPGSAAECALPLPLRLGEFVAEGQALSALEDGATLHLWNAPQGGHVLLVGAEVHSSSAEIVTIRASLLDPDSELVVKENLRSIVMQPIANDPGWMSPDVRSRSQVAHIAVCPDAERREFLHRDFLLKVEIEQVDPACPRRGSAELRVTPACAQADAAEREYCTCQCQPTYVAGACGP